MFSELRRKSLSRILQLRIKSGKMSTAVTMHQAVGEAALMSSSSSFCRGSALSGQIQSQTMHSAAKPGASLVKGVAAIRCSSFSSADEHSVDRRSPLVNFSSSTRRNPLMDAGLKTTFSYKKEKICATNGATEASLPNFAGSLSHGYDVSEPTKVAADNIEETSESSVLQRLKQGFVKFKEERFLYVICLLIFSGHCQSQIVSSNFILAPIESKGAVF